MGHLSQSASDMPGPIHAIAARVRWSACSMPWGHAILIVANIILEKRRVSSPEAKNALRLWRELQSHPIREWVTDNGSPYLPHDEAPACRMTDAVLRVVRILLDAIVRPRCLWRWLLRLVEYIGVMADQVLRSDPSAWRARRMLTAPPQCWAAP